MLHMSFKRTINSHFILYIIILYYKQNREYRINTFTYDVTQYKNSTTAT